MLDSMINFLYSFNVYMYFFFFLEQIEFLCVYLWAKSNVQPIIFWVIRTFFILILNLPLPHYTFIMVYKLYCNSNWRVHSDIIWIEIKSSIHWWANLTGQLQPINGDLKFWNMHYYKKWFFLSDLNNGVK